MNKYKLYMIFGIVLLVLSITGSLAYYVWSSSTTSIAGNLCLPEIYFTYFLRLLLYMKYSVTRVIQANARTSSISKPPL